MPTLTDTQVAVYHTDGYLLVPQMFSVEEIDLIGRAAREDRELDAQSQGRDDGDVAWMAKQVDKSARSLQKQ